MTIIELKNAIERVVRQSHGFGGMGHKTRVVFRDEDGNEFEVAGGIYGHSAEGATLVLAPIKLDGVGGF